MASWTPAAAGADFELSPTLQPLEPFKDSLVVVSNLKRAGGQAEMHAAAASRLAERRDPEADRRRGLRVSARRSIRCSRGRSARRRRFPSLEFATEDFTGYVGGCTPGYSCAYQNTISWASPTTPLPMEINPRDRVRAAVRRRRVRRGAAPRNLREDREHPRLRS